MTVYDRIRALRIKAGMTQDDLARAMGYKDRSMITKIESGKVDISQKKVDKFAEVLHTTSAYLMGWEEKPLFPEDRQAIDNLLDMLIALTPKNRELARKIIVNLMEGEDE